jgi:hypothetical protein
MTEVRARNSLDVDSAQSGPFGCPPQGGAPLFRTAELLKSVDSRRHRGEPRRGKILPSP